MVFIDWYFLVRNCKSAEELFYTKSSPKPGRRLQRLTQFFGGLEISLYTSSVVYHLYFYSVCVVSTFFKSISFWCIYTPTISLDLWQYAQCKKRCNILNPDALNFHGNYEPSLFISLHDFPERTHFSHLLQL